MTPYGPKCIRFWHEIYHLNLRGPYTLHFYGLVHELRKILPERVACKVCGLNYVQSDTLSIKVVPDDLYCDYNNLAQSQIRVLLTIGITISDFLIL